MKHPTEISLQIQQRINVLFCVKLGLSLKETREKMNVAYGTNSLSYSRIQFWYRTFEGGRICVVDLPRAAKVRTGRSDENIQAVRNTLALDKRLTIDDILEFTGIKTGNIQRILKLDLGLVRKCARFVPHLLTGAQERSRLENSTLMLQRAGADPTFLPSIVTMDESWVYVYDLDMRMHASQWLPKGSDPPVICKREMSTKKVLLVSFFDHQGVVHCEFLHNTTVTAEVFVSILRRFRTSLRIRRPRLFRSFWLHMDNASPHTALETRRFLLQTGTQVVPHPPYSPDLAPNDFFFYPQVKRELKGRRFASLDEVEREVDNQIALIPARDFHECILAQLPRHWARYVNNAGSYFKGLGGHD